MNRVWIEPAVLIERIKSDPRLQPRAEDKLDEWHVNNMPADVDVRWPIDVFRIDGRGDVLAHGHYRLERVTRAGRSTINARIHEGTLRDAFVFSRGQNRENAKELTEKDVQHSIFQSFDERKKGELGWFTDTEIAKWHNLSHQWVSKLRQRWEGDSPQASNGTGSGGDSETDSADALDRGEVEDGDDEDDEEEAAPSKPARKPRKKKIVLEPLPDLDFDLAATKGAAMLADNDGADAAVLRHHFADHFRKCLQPALAVLAAQGLLAKHRKALEKMYAEVRGD